MIIPVQGLSLALAFLVGSFLIWRTLREDYPEEEILSFTIAVTLFVLLSSRIFFLLGHFSDFGFDFGKWIFWTRFSGLSLPGAFLGGVFFSFWWSLKKNWDFWVLLDSLVPVFLISLILGSLGAFLSHPELLTLGKFFWAGLAGLFCFFISRNFRKFIWYKSGRPGFVACSVASFYFFGFSLLAFFFQTGLYFEVVLALGIVVFGLSFFYQRSGRIIQEDVANFWQFLKGLKIKK